MKENMFFYEIRADWSYLGRSQEREIGRGSKMMAWYKNIHLLFLVAMICKSEMNLITESSTVCSHLHDNIDRQFNPRSWYSIQ